MSVTLLLILTVLALLGAAWLAYEASVLLFPMILQPEKVEDWLKIGGMVVAIATFAGTQLWRWGKTIFGLYDNIYNWLVVVKKKQRSLNCWNGRVKSAWLIAFQQLRYAKAR